MIIPDGILERGIHVKYDSDVTRQYLIGALRKIAELTGKEHLGNWVPCHEVRSSDRYIILFADGTMCISDRVVSFCQPATQRVGIVDIQETVAHLEYEALPYKFRLMAGCVVLAGGYATLEEAEAAGEAHTRSTKESVTVVEMRTHATFTRKVTETVEVVRS